MDTKNESINISTKIFEAKQATKRKNESAPMDVDTHNGIEGKSSWRPTNAKRSKHKSESEKKDETRKVPVPAHRYTPLKENWMKIFTPIVEHLQLQIRFNLKTRNVEIRTCADTTDIANLQKAADFVKVREF